MITTQSNPIGSTGPGLAVVRRFVDEVLNGGRVDVLDEIVHPDYRYVGPDGTELHGVEQLAHLVAGYRGAFSDLHASITSEVADGALVAMTMTLTGTHDGALDGLPPTGQSLSLPMAVVTRVEGDRIIEDREFYDTATMLAQLGVGNGPVEAAT